MRFYLVVLALMAATPALAKEPVRGPTVAQVREICLNRSPQTQQACSEITTRVLQAVTGPTYLAEVAPDQRKCLERFGVVYYSRLEEIAKFSQSLVFNLGMAGPDNSQDFIQFYLDLIYKDYCGSRS